VCLLPAAATPAPVTVALPPTLATAAAAATPAQGTVGLPPAAATMTAATATPAPVTAADMPAAAAARVAGSKGFKPQKDDALFSAYLDSEIKKNIAKTELIQLKKYKFGLEIKKLETELGLSGSDVVYLLPSEQ